MKPFVIPLLLFHSLLLSGQVDTTDARLAFYGYAEIFYAYDFSKPDDHLRPAFLYSHNRHNEFNLNLGFVKAAYASPRIRANFALAAGTYMNANYATEPGVLQNLYEANAGVKISGKHNLWIDAGIMNSHIGFESAVSKDCLTLTRSMLAENSPYYESGVKLTYITSDNKWLFSGLILNGWQRITRPVGNNTPAFGTQVTFTPNEQLVINYSTFIGNDQPDDEKRMRYFHNLYGRFHVSEKIHLTAGFDYGMEHPFAGSNEFNKWFSPVIIARCIFNDQWSVTARGEFYSDGDGVIIPTGTEHGFQTSGFSLNLDYQIQENAVWRIEGRLLKSKDEVFVKEGRTVDTNTCLTTSLAVSF